MQLIFFHVPKIWSEQKNFHIYTALKICMKILIHLHIYHTYMQGI